MLTSDGIQQDKLIREGVALYAKEGSPNWTAVGKHAGLLGSQAAKRWHDYLHPDHETRKHDAWVQDEVYAIWCIPFACIVILCY